MPLLHLHLLGGFEIRGTDDQDLTPRSRRACGMLACLALPPGTAWPRDRIALTFWSERSEGQARGSVRQALADLRRSLGAGAILSTERDAVMLKPDAVTVDAMEFEKAAKAGDLDQAAELYRGDLLESFTLRSSEFSDWLLVERTRLRDLAIDVFGRLISSQSGEAAIQSCLRLLQIDPTREEAHRLLMTLYARHDQRALALRQFQICRDILKRELDAEPDSKTEALFRQLQKSESHFPQVSSDGPATSSIPSNIPSIAVMSFVNMSGDDKEDCFGDCIAENILTNLSRFRDLLVIARNSTFAFKGKAVNIQDVSRELGARYVLEGSIQKVGDRIRITAQLIDGTTGGHVWAERYDRQFEDVFAVQDEVTETIVGTLATAFGGRLRKAWHERPEGAAGRNFEAFDCFTRGVAIFDGFAKEDGRSARDFFIKAIKLNPKYGKAIAKLALTHIIDAVFGHSDNLPESWKNAEKFANLAIERDDGEAWGHWALGVFYLYQNRHDRALAELSRALELNPNDADPMTDYAMILSYAGQREKAIEMAHKAMRLNPHNPSWYVMQYGQILFDDRRYGEAVRVLESVRGFGTIWIDLYLAANHMAVGHSEAARSAIGRALKRDPSASIEKWTIKERTPYKDPSDRERLRDYLRKAGLPEQQSTD